MLYQSILFKNECNNECNFTKNDELEHAMLLTVTLG